MDALSCQANLAGYRAVIEGAEAYGRALPMMMTAAGTVAAAKVFVMGAGVAGLQAIATARRLGAVVTATDVRPASKEQVESLGAKFVAVEDEEFKSAETAAGYAKPMSRRIPGQAGGARLRAYPEAGHRHHHGPDPRPRLRPGWSPQPRSPPCAPARWWSIWRSSRAATCEAARAGETVTTDSGVKVVGIANLAGRIAADASSLYARNLGQPRRPADRPRSRRWRPTGTTRSSRPPWSPTAAPSFTPR